VSFKEKAFSLLIPNNVREVIDHFKSSRIYLFPIFNEQVQITP